MNEDIYNITYLKYEISDIKHKTSLYYFLYKIFHIISPILYFLCKISHIYYLRYLVYYMSNIIYGVNVNTLAICGGVSFFFSFLLLYSVPNVCSSTKMVN